MRVWVEYEFACFVCFVCTSMCVEYECVFVCVFVQTCRLKSVVMCQ